MSYQTMIQPFLGDIVFVGIGSVCVLIVSLLVLDGLWQGHEKRRERKAKARLAKSLHPRSSGNWMAGRRLRFSRWHLIVLFVCSIVFAALLKGHGVTKISATTDAVVPPANQLSSNVLPDKAVAELPDTNSVIFQRPPLTSGTNSKAMATNLISVDLYSNSVQIAPFGNVR